MTWGSASSRPPPSWPRVEPCCWDSWVTASLLRDFEFKLNCFSCLYLLIVLHFGFLSHGFFPSHPQRFSTPLACMLSWVSRLGGSFLCMHALLGIRPRQTNAPPSLSTETGPLRRLGRLGSAALSCASESRHVGGWARQARRWPIGETHRRHGTRHLRYAAGARRLRPVDSARCTVTLGPCHGASRDGARAACTGSISSA